MSVTLKIDGERFLLNGQAVFLLGASYYAGLGAAADVVERDFTELRRLGVNWVRVWCTWGAYGYDISAVDARGAAGEPYLSRLVELCRQADRLGLVVDVSFQRAVTADKAAADKGLAGFARMPWMQSPIATHEDHLRAVATVTEALRGAGNVYIDVSNERDLPHDLVVSFEDAGELIARVRQVDQHRLVTVSGIGDCAGEDLRNYLSVAKVDFLAPHRHRGSDSPAQTLAVTQQLRREMVELGRPVPIHYQEPLRRDHMGWDPSVEDFLTDLDGAVRGGAAGWCFHNGFSRSADGCPRRSFDLRDGSLFDQLDAVELAVLQQAAGVVKSASALRT